MAKVTKGKDGVISVSGVNGLNDLFTAIGKAADMIVKTTAKHTMKSTLKRSKER